MTSTFAIKFDHKECHVYRYVGRDVSYGVNAPITYEFNLAELHLDVSFVHTRRSYKANGYYLPLIELLGMTFDDPTVQDYIKHCPFPIISENNQPRFVAEETWTFSIEEVMALTMKRALHRMIFATNLEKLDKSKNILMSFSRNYATKLKKFMRELAVVVVVPNSFGEAQRRAIKVAADLAGMNVTHIVSQTTSVAYFFNTANIRAPGMENKSRLSRGGNFLFFHFDGSSLDISIIEHNEEEKLVEIKLATGDSTFGGKDFMQRLMEGVPRKFIDCDGSGFKQACMLLNHDEFAFVPPQRMHLYWLERGTHKFTKGEVKDFKEDSKLYHSVPAKPWKMTLEQRKEARKAEKVKLKKASYRITRQMYDQKCGDLLDRVRQILTEAISEAGIAPSDYKSVQMYGEYCRLSGIVGIIREQLPDTLISFVDNTSPYCVKENNIEYFGRSRERSELQPWNDRSTLHYYDYDLMGAACMSFVLNQGRPLYRARFLPSDQRIPYKNLRLINKSQVEHLAPSL